MDVAQLKAVGTHVIYLMEQRVNPVAKAEHLLHRGLGDTTAGRRRMLM